MIAAPAWRQPWLPTSFVLMALFGGAAARAQQPPPAASGKELRLTRAALGQAVAEWRAAARAHAAGTFDEPAASIARWGEERTRAVVDHAVRELERERVAARAGAATGVDSTAVGAKGLVLHTDIAIAERTGEAGTTSGTPDAVVLDAKPHASRWFSSHWTYARLLANVLAEAAAGGAARDAGRTRPMAIARAWYRVAGALFQQWGDLGHLHAHLVDAEGVLGDDPVLLLYRGTLHQGYADARLQSYLEQRRRSMRALPEGTVRLEEGTIRLDRHNRAGSLPAFESAGTELESAERALRRALALDASLVEARIRLAHVRERRGKPAEAAALARQALAEPLPAFLEYYAAMVLGRATATLGDHAEARAAFERAAARYPGSQASQVALSHLAIDGSPGMAAEDLVRALGSDDPAVADDPWWWYFRLHEPDAKALFEALTATVS